MIGVAALRAAAIPLWTVARLQCLTCLGGLLGAKLYSLVERDWNWSPLAHELTQGYRHPGAILGVAVAVFAAKATFLRGVRLGTLADVLAPSVGVGVAILRLGCFAAGCCYGTVCHWPWCLRFPAESPPWQAHVGAGWLGRGLPESLPVHPLQLYFAAAALVAAAVARAVDARKSYAGQAALAFLCVDQLMKFGLEYLRHDPLPGVQYAALGIGLAATVALVMIRATVRRGRRRPRNQCRPLARDLSEP